MSCPITGDALIQDTANGPLWVRADEEIHVAVELLTEDDARRQVEARYEVGEPCPYHPQSRHARLLTPRPLTDHEINRARLYCADQATDADELREFLGMLGLESRDG